MYCTTNGYLPKHQVSSSLEQNVDVCTLHRDRQTSVPVLTKSLLGRSEKLKMHTLNIRSSWPVTWQLIRNSYNLKLRPTINKCKYHEWRIEWCAWAMQWHHITHTQMHSCHVWPQCMLSHHLAIRQSMKPSCFCCSGSCWASKCFCWAHSRWCQNWLGGSFQANRWLVTGRKRWQFCHMFCYVWYRYITQVIDWILTYNDTYQVDSHHHEQQLRQWLHSSTGLYKWPPTCNFKVIKSGEWSVRNVKDLFAFSIITREQKEDLGDDGQCQRLNTDDHNWKLFFLRTHFFSFI